MQAIVLQAQRTQQGAGQQPAQPILFRTDANSRKIGASAATGSDA